MQTADQSPLVILTVGHSTWAIEEFLALLVVHGVKFLVDVRTIPRSRHNPQFNLESLPDSLAAAGIEYTHLKGLGGLRHALKDSVNTGWRNASFRGYADYMQTGNFASSLAELMDLAAKQRVAIMCAEAVPWRCHRSLIADALLVHGARVEHITSLKEARPHALTPWARVNGTRITYPPSPECPLPLRDNPCPISIIHGARREEPRKCAVASSAGRVGNFGGRWLDTPTLPAASMSLRAPDTRGIYCGIAEQIRQRNKIPR